MSTAEIESALVLHARCAEAAVVSIPDDITGEAIVCFVSIKPGGAESTTDLQKVFRQQVRDHIGPFATPKFIIIVNELPQTRSGKIMRRILRKVASKEIKVEHADDVDVIREKLGDTSTLAKREVVKDLILAFNAQI